MDLFTSYNKRRSLGDAGKVRVFAKLADLKQFPKEYEICRKVLDVIVDKKTKRELCYFSDNAIYTSTEYILYKQDCTVAPEAQEVAAPDDKLKSMTNLMANKSIKLSVLDKSVIKNILPKLSDIEKLMKIDRLAVNLGQNTMIALGNLKKALRIINTPKITAYKTVIQDINSVILEAGNETVLVMGLFDAHISYNLASGRFDADEQGDDWITTNCLDKINFNNIQGSDKYFCTLGEYRNIKKAHAENQLLCDFYYQLTGTKIEDKTFDPDESRNLNVMDLSQFVVDDDLRPVMSCIGYQSGYAIATDAHILVAVRNQYIPERDGETYNISGYNINEGGRNRGQFPSVVNLMKESFVPMAEVDFDIKRIQKAMDMVKGMLNSMQNVGVQHTIIKPSYLKKVFYFLKYCTNPKVYINPKGWLYITDKEGVHNLILTNVEWKSTTPYADSRDLKFKVATDDWDEIISENSDFDDRAKAEESVEVIKKNYVNISHIYEKLIALQAKLDRVKRANSALKAKLISENKYFQATTIGRTTIYGLGAVGRNLPHQIYDLVSIERKRLDDGDLVFQCQHCGTAIVSYAIIKGLTDGREYMIGLQCLSRLQAAGMEFKGLTPESWEGMQKEINKHTRYILEIQKEMEGCDPSKTFCYFNVNSYDNLLSFNYECHKDGKDGHGWRSDIPIYCMNLYKGLVNQYYTDAKAQRHFKELQARAAEEKKNYNVAKKRYYALNVDFFYNTYILGRADFWAKFSKLMDFRQNLAKLNLMKPWSKELLQAYRKEYPHVEDLRLKSAVQRLLEYYVFIRTAGGIGETIARYLLKNDFARRWMGRMLGVSLPDKIRKLQEVSVKRIDLAIKNQ